MIAAWAWDAKNRRQRVSGSAMFVSTGTAFGDQRDERLDRLVQIPAATREGVAEAAQVEPVAGTRGPVEHAEEVIELDRRSGLALDRDRAALREATR